MGRNEDASLDAYVRIVRIAVEQAAERWPHLAEAFADAARAPGHDEGLTTDEVVRILTVDLAEAAFRGEEE